MTNSAPTSFTIKVLNMALPFIVAQRSLFASVLGRLSSPATMRFDLKFDASEVLNSFKAIPRSFKRHAESAMVKTSAEIVRVAKSLAPVDTGALRRNIRARWRMDRRGKIRQVVSAAPYSIFIEYGRKKLQRKDAQPFLRPAMAHGASVFLSILKQEIDAALAESSRGGIAVPLDSISRTAAFAGAIPSFSESSDNDGESRRGGPEFSRASRYGSAGGIGGSGGNIGSGLKKKRKKRRDK